METPNSIPALIGSLLDDTRDLIREEVALARAEVKQELAKAQAAAVAFGGAALAGMCGLILLCVALGGAIAYMIGWPAWAGYGIVAILLLGSAYGLVKYGSTRLATLSSALPETRQTVKENLQWMRNKSVEK